MLDLQMLSHQKEYEKMEITLHQHWIIPFQLFLALLITITLPLVGFGFVETYMPEFFAMNGFRAFAILGTSMYALLAALYLFQTYLDFHLDIWIVTNERIISAERESLFHYTMSELRLYQVQDVKAEVKGFMANALNYGDVVVQTAGKQIQFTFENIPDPKGVAQKILALTDADRRFHKDKIAELA